MERQHEQRNSSSSGNEAKEKVVVRSPWSSTGSQHREHSCQARQCCSSKLVSASFSQNTAWLGWKGSSSKCDSFMPACQVGVFTRNVTPVSGRHWYHGITSTNRQSSNN